VKHTQLTAPEGGTHWRRFAAITVVATVVVAAIGVSIDAGAVPVTFSVSGSQFKVTALHLHGTNFVQYGGIVQEKNGTPHTVAVSQISEADLTSLCQSVDQSTPIGTVVLKLTAGDNGTQAHASNLLIDMSQLSGDATFTRIDIGQDASDLSPSGPPGGRHRRHRQPGAGLVGDHSGHLHPAAPQSETGWRGHRVLVGRTARAFREQPFAGPRPG
jgi:hypothetical protein